MQPLFRKPLNRHLRAQSGDKVRLKTGPAAGQRGLVFLVGGSQLGVTLEDGRQVSASPADLTNYSLAARRAWAAMPKKAGRPPAPVARTRMISVRIDASVLVEADRAVSAGRFPNRTAAIEAGLKLVLRRSDTDGEAKMSIVAGNALISRER